MKQKTEQGFTLIELLVVVLIIGILAAIAVPQYQKAIEKSKAKAVLPLLKAVYHANEAYFLANGEYATKFNQLDVDIPWNGSTRWVNTGSTDARSNGEWSLQLYNWGSGYKTMHRVSMGRISGPYKGGGFVIWHKNTYDATPDPLHQILCIERDGDGVVFNKNNGDYCAKIFGGTSTGKKTAFTLPN